MIPSNGHTHTNHSDGKNTIREVIEQAINLGMTGLGITDHSPAPFDESCLGILDERAYIDEVKKIREEYDISVLCGVELDYYGPVKENYEYTIASVHYLPHKNEKYYAVDDTPEQIYQALEEQYERNAMKMVRDYYELVLEHVNKSRPEIVGHYDLITKLNPRECYFDESSKEYKNIALSVLDEVINIIKPYGGIIEINTGAMSRGYRKIPYPANFLLEHLAKRDVRIMINSDSHEINTLNSYFKEALELAKLSKMKNLCIIKNKKFEDVKIEEL